MRKSLTLFLCFVLVQASIEARNLLRLSRDKEVEAWTLQVLGRMGLHLPVRVVRETAASEDACAYATTHEDTPVIAYYPECFNRDLPPLPIPPQATVTQLDNAHLICHEIAHLLQRHSWRHGKPTLRRQMEAERFSGFCLNRAGATLEQALRPLQGAGRPPKLKEYPTVKQSVALITEGWNKAAHGTGSTGGGFVLPPPVVVVEEEESGGLAGLAGNLLLLSGGLVFLCLASAAVFRSRRRKLPSSPSPYDRRFPGYHRAQRPPGLSRARFRPQRNRS